MRNVIELVSLLLESALNQIKIWRLTRKIRKAEAEIIKDLQNGATVEDGPLYPEVIDGKLYIRVKK